MTLCVSALVRLGGESAVEALLLYVVEVLREVNDDMVELGRKSKSLLTPTELFL